jgi:serine protease Do
VTYQNTTYILNGNFSLSQLFEQVRESVVVVQAIIIQYDVFGHPYYTQVQGSGFVYSINGQMVVLTNYHVVNGATDINVTFTTGNSYTAIVLGSDQFKDLTVLSTDAPQNQYSPLEIVSSSTLNVGDPVIVVGTPYGLTGSMSEGIVSALDRTLETGDYSITSVIQTTAPINPGNSGGPLLNYQGQVVGIVTAIIQDSQGIGFAIPSDTILEGIQELLD